MLHPELSLKLMRRAGHRVDEARRQNVNDSELKRLITQRELAEKIFLKHTSQMNVRDLHALRCKVIP